MWPFKKRVERVENEVAPVKREVLPCWCGSKEYTQASSFIDIVECANCGAMYYTQDRKNPRV